ncbi:hypothetical protein BN2475_1250024 [Paraburkholderia ribeironis]|uniref:Uncharacterized protein n=1 Tax=Paraburkholderia ribeironis TaxID=1247936 RepID=A0A1N7SNT6_9BURK|nr:hypothetical protein BN2475_1250024 [Paraburkholderia ribeironis]
MTFDAENLIGLALDVMILGATGQSTPHDRNIGFVEATFKHNSRRNRPTFHRFRIAITISPGLDSRHLQTGSNLIAKRKLSM